MVRDYVEDMYEPIARRADALSGKQHERARALAAWKQRVVAAWPEVRVVDVDGDSVAVTDLGDTRKVTAVVDLGSLTSDDVAVELVHGPVGANDELTSTEVVRMTLVGPAGGPAAGGPGDGGPADGRHVDGSRADDGSVAATTDPGGRGDGTPVVPAPMQPTAAEAPTAAASSGARFRYQGGFDCDQAGRHGFTVRVVPDHPDQVVEIETGCIAWA